MAKNLKMDYLMQNGRVVNLLIRRKNGTYKKTKKTSNGSTKSYIEETKTNKKKKEEVNYAKSLW
jgi:spore germination protein GerM